MKLLFFGQVFLGVMFGSISMGQAIPQIEAFSAARGAAADVFEIIDLVHNLKHWFDREGISYTKKAAIPRL